MEKTGFIFVLLLIFALLFVGIAGAESRSETYGPFAIASHSDAPPSKIASRQPVEDRFQLDGIGLEVAVDDTTTLDVGFHDPTEPKAGLRSDFLDDDRPLMLIMTRIF